MPVSGNARSLRLNMKWQVVTLNKTYTVEANSSKDAYEQVQQKTDDQIMKVSVAPKGLKSNLRKKWRDWFGK